MAQMVIKDKGSNYSEDTSFDDELSDWQRDSMNYAKQLAASRNPIDKRFIDLYVCRKMEEEGVSLGFQNNGYINREQKLSLEPIEMVRQMAAKNSIIIPRANSPSKLRSTPLSPISSEQT